MLISGAPLNTSPLNAALTDSEVAPIIVAGPNAIRWYSRVIIGGEDVSTRLVGEQTTDREEGAAAVCDFTIYLPEGPVAPTDWRGRPVSLDYIDGQGESRLFTGRIGEPVWNRTSRTLTCACSDQLQERVEAMEVAAIDALVAGDWSEDVFEPVVGRSHWDYALERMSTRTGSLDCAPDGTLRVTSWYAKPVADYAFGVGATVYGTVDVQLSDNTRETNLVVIEADYRFQRLHQLNTSYYWQHPLTSGLGGTGGFCLWQADSTEVPSVDMVVGALSDSGQTLLSGAHWNRLPGSGVYCDPPVIWGNVYTDLLLGFSAVGARRWAQAVTERYTLTVRADAAIAAAGEVVGRDSVALEVESARADEWESTPFGVNTVAPSAGGSNNGLPFIGSGGLTPGRPADDGESGHEDIRDESRRQLALRIKLHQAVVSIIGAHRGTVISWDVPAGWVHGIDLGHTVIIDDQGVRARGNVIRIRHRQDLLSGSALATISIAVMRGGGDVSDPLEPPPFSVDPQPEPPAPDPIADSLPTQIGGRGEVYDDNLDGFSGTWSVGDGISEGFQRRFQVTAVEIAEAQRDAREVIIAGDYRIAIPNDTLELY